VTERSETRGYKRRWMLVALGGCAVNVALGMLVLLVVMSFLTALASPGPNGCGPEPADPGFCLRATIQDRHVVVTGTTTLPDGAVVVIWGSGSAPDLALPVTQATTSGGVFTGIFDVSAWPPGHIIVTARLRISDQPTEIVARYGADGARFVGPAARYDYDFSPPLQDLVVWAEVELRD
jgi:hypothetical protein